MKAKCKSCEGDVEVGEDECKYCRNLKEIVVEQEDDGEG